MGSNERRRVDAVIRRGDIHLVDLEPVRGSEANKRRPGVVISNDAANATASRLGRGVVTVIPITSSAAHIYPFQVLLPAGRTGLDRDSKAQAEQIRSVAVERIGTRLGAVPGDLLLELEEAVRLHVGL
jgi:mRNA interferase MazF